jgi:predicted MFS family arabinose efflux permease
MSTVGTGRRSALALLVLGNAVSMSANVVLTVAVPWLVLTTTGSAAVAGMVVFAGVASAAAGGLAAGRVVDVIGPVRASSVSDLLSGLAVAPIPVLLTLGALQVWQLVLLTVLGTLADSAGSVARQSLVPAAADIGGYRRERANALFTSAEHIGYLVGAPAAGLLIGVFGVQTALGASVVAFGFSSLFVLGLGHLSASRHTSEAADAPRLRETFAFIWRDPGLRALVVFPTAAVMLVGPLAPLVLPILARDVFDDPIVLGLLVAGYGAGGLLGAVGYGALGLRLPRKSLYRSIFVVWPCAYGAILFVPSLPITLAMLLLLGAAAGSLVPLQATIRQSRTPARLLPSVVGLSTASIPVAAPTGALVTGFLVDDLGLGRASLLLTAAALLVGIAVLASSWTTHLDAADESVGAKGLEPLTSSL